MALGKNVKRNREARGWDQKTLSRLSGVSVVTISAMEVRDSKRSDKTAELARAFGISVESLLNGSDEAASSPAPAPAASPSALEQALQIIDDAMAPLDALDRRAALSLLTIGMERPGRASSVALTVAGAIASMSSKLKAA